MINQSILYLPPKDVDFFGREAELQWLDTCWQTGVHVAAIVDEHNVGKTSLVTKWLANMRDAGWPEVDHRYFWSFCGQGTTLGMSSDWFFTEALEAFDDPNPIIGSPWDKAARLIKLVRNERTLLVLDGVDNLQYGPGVFEGGFKDPALQMLVQHLAAQNNGLLVLTSRRPLRDLPGLSGPKVQTKALQRLSADAGAQLLRARGVEGTEENLFWASKEFNGHGLALVLLASYLGHVADGDIRECKNIPKLRNEMPFGGHARRVLQAYDRVLGPVEIAILRLLGLFDRPASEQEIRALQAAPAVRGLNESLVGINLVAWNEAITLLEQNNLLVRDPSGTIDTHPLIRQYFGEQLKQLNRDAWREGHRRLYEFLRLDADEFPDTASEMDPLFAAVVHGCLAGRHQEAYEEVWQKRIQRGDEEYNSLQLGTLRTEMATLAAFFEPPWDKLAKALPEEVQYNIFRDSSLALRALGRLREAKVLLQDAFKWHALVNDDDGALASSLAGSLCELHMCAGDSSEAEEIAQHGIKLAERSGDDFQRLTSRATLAAVLLQMGRFRRALEMFAEAEQIQKEYDSDYPLLYGLRGFWYCELLLDQGRIAEAQERAEKFFEWRVEGDSLLTITLDHLALGRAHLVNLQWRKGGKLDVAKVELDQAVEGFRHANRLDYLPLALMARAALHMHVAAYADARHDLQEALGITTRSGFRLHECDAHLGYARLGVLEKRAMTAQEHLEHARTIIEATGYHRRDEEVKQIQGYIDRLLG